MAKITVWTKQNKKVLEELDAFGRFLTERAYIVKDLEEHAELVLETYEWLAKHTTNLAWKPEDARFPIWVSFQKNATMLPDNQTVILELSVEEASVAHINIAKWGQILNYGYIPQNEEDEKRHKQLLREYGVSDVKAYMSQFYPQIRAEIKDSWMRLFDPDIKLGNDSEYGNIWEVRKEWITGVIQ